MIGIDQLILIEDKDPTVQFLAGKIKKEGETVLSVVNRILNQAVEAAGSSKKEGDIAVPALDGKKVLSIDDTPINLKIIEGLLGLTDATVVSVKSGHEGLERMRQEHFDLVLIDHQMPVMDGMTCIQMIRQHEQDGIYVDHVPVIAVSANARPEQIQRVLFFSRHKG